MLDRFNDPVQRDAGGGKALRKSLNPLPMFAVDDDFSFAVNLAHQRSGQHVDRVPQSGLGRMAVLERLWHFSRQVAVVQAAEGRVHRQQGLIDGEQGKAMFTAPKGQGFDVPHFARDGMIERTSNHACEAVQDFAPGFRAAGRFEKGGVRPAAVSARDSRWPINRRRGLWF